jgi:uncharacterized membrane protein
MARAAGLLHGAILSVKKVVVDSTTGQKKFESGVKVDEGLFSVSFGHITDAGNGHKVTLSDYNTMRDELPAHNRVFVSIPNTATYFPLAYIPAALGLRAGLMFNISPFDCMIVARIAMLLVALALGVCALWVTTYGEAFILTILLLPMTLFLAASLNEDGILISLACLAAAAFTVEVRVQPKVRWVGLACLAVILLSKPAYLPILGLAIVPIEWQGLWQRLQQFFLAAVPVFVWVAILILFVVIPFYRAPYHPGPLYSGNPNAYFIETNSGENLHILAAHPLKFFYIAWSTLTFWRTALIESSVGMLGLLDVIFPVRFYDAWLIALSAAFLGTIASKRCRSPVAFMSWWSGSIVILCIILACLTVMVSFYLSWTDVGSGIIEGLQGRYILILLPLTILAAPEALAGFLIPDIVPAIPAIVLGFYDIGFIPIKIVAFYYLR